MQNIVTSGNLSISQLRQLHNKPFQGFLRLVVEPTQLLRQLLRLAVIQEI